MFCCTRAQRKKAANTLGNLTKTNSGPMFARLEEFDVLTPLQPTPSTSLATEPYKSYGSASNSSVSSDSQIQLIPPHLPSASDSPPPPRRPHSGKTLIVPLNASRYRTPLVMTAGTPDSRLTSFECGTTKSCATIPEDDEDEIDELLSIDRTSISAPDQQSSRYYYSCTLSLPQPMPEFQLPAPAYSPPSLPSESPITRPLSPDGDRESTYENTGTQSPHSSASLSDSVYANNYDIISSAANSQVFEASICGESDVMSKFQLHRIEEESECGDDASNVCSSNNYKQPVAANSQFFPRSISQQFDMLRQQ
ncbi:unnamed protein product [Caenorhabditis bovis]|uniref:Uncharacterized protein n=1 Tax=Caenorhabditis bovis TaxID=2654633 RepID=A0A8S1ERQ1_9PELO|nr:unnamed protein product [Caenorhabditis bovis]